MLMKCDIQKLDLVKLSCYEIYGGSQKSVRHNGDMGLRLVATYRLRTPLLRF
jgi:hypothetical protein